MWFIYSSGFNQGIWQCLLIFLVVTSGGVCVCVSVMFLEGEAWAAADQGTGQPQETAKKPCPLCCTRCDLGAWRWEGVLPAPQHQLQSTLPPASPSPSEWPPLPLFFFQISVVVVQSPSRVQLFVTPRTVARQVSLFFTISQSAQTHPLSQ